MKKKTLFLFLLFANFILAKAQSNLNFTANGVSFTMIYVKGGTFTMGSDDKESMSDEGLHRVTLSDYYIGQTEVTQALWQAVMDDNPSYNKGSNLPVEVVSFYDCLEFIRRLNNITGQHFRFPTEAEWEYASRGGNKSCGYKYSGGNKLQEVAWCLKNSGGKKKLNVDKYDTYKKGEKTHDVATKTPNELGIYDMSGNVFEWCNDWWDYYPEWPVTNPQGPSEGLTRVIRGGSFTSTVECRVAYRGYAKQDVILWNLGLRLAL